MVKLVTKKASSEARQRADKIIRDVHKKLGKEYKFFCRPIGSQTRRCIVQDKNGKYDLDYQGLCSIGRTKTKSGRAETDKPN